MRAVEEAKNWLISLCRQNMTEPHEALVNPAALTEQDVRNLYDTINDNDILYQVVLNRDHYTNQAFFSWFFQFAERLTVKQVVNAFEKKDQYKVNALQLLFINSDEQIVRLWMGWAARLMESKKTVDLYFLFELLRERGEYDLQDVQCPSHLMSYLIYKRRELVTMLLNWVSQLQTKVAPIHAVRMVGVLKLGYCVNNHELIDDLINIRDEHHLNEYLLFIQHIGDAGACVPWELIHMIYRIDEPDYYRKKLLNFSSSTKANYKNVVGEILFKTAQHWNILRMRFSALCSDQSVGRLKLFGLVVSEDEIRRLLLRFIDELTQNERQDAFKKALDKNHPVGKYMLFKSPVPTAREKAFENEIRLKSLRPAGAIAGVYFDCGLINRAVLFQPDVRRAHESDQQRVEMRNIRS